MISEKFADEERRRDFTRVFIKYDDCFRGAALGDDILVSEKSIGSRCDCNYGDVSQVINLTSNFAKDIIHCNLVLNKIICTAFRF